MKNVSIVLSKLVKKALAFVLFSVLSVFVFAYKATFFIYRWLVVPFAAIGAFLYAAEGFMSSFSVEIVLIILALSGIIALRYLLPRLIPAAEEYLNRLQHYIVAPMFFKPPVRYTI